MKKLSWLLLALISVSLSALVSEKENTPLSLDLRVQLLWNNKEYKKEDKQIEKQYTDALDELEAQKETLHLNEYQQKLKAIEEKRLRDLENLIYKYKPELKEKHE